MGLIYCYLQDSKTMNGIKVDSFCQKTYDTISDDKYLSDAIPKLREQEHQALIVEDQNGDYNGVITRRLANRTRQNKTQTKIKTLAARPPRIQSTEDVAEAARLIIESGSPVLIVYRGEKLVGFITRDAILENAAGDDWASTSVKQVMTENPVTARPNDSIAHVLELFRTYGFSHAPVTEDGKLEGIVSIQDLIDVVYRSRDRQKGRYGGAEDHGGQGERAGEKSDLVHMSISSVMSYPVYAAKPSDSIQEAENKMRENDISSLVVIEEDRPVGIITKRDLLEPIAQKAMEKKRISVQFSVKPGIRMSEEEKAAMRREFDSFVRRYKDVVGIGGLFAYFKQYGPVSKGNQLIQCRLQFRTAHTQYYSTAEAWSVEEAYKLALDRLEREVIEHKETKLDEEHSRRHIENLLKSEEL
ncbi:CBS domain-containing protein [Candidatus Thorarchaeota archaeon]|nr:MAG: CBS domain-containing protein [Candidatus Thorarchaeota archaeon]